MPSTQIQGMLKGKLLEAKAHAKRLVEGEKQIFTLNHYYMDTLSKLKAAALRSSKASQAATTPVPSLLAPPEKLGAFGGQLSERTFQFGGSPAQGASTGYGAPLANAATSPPQKKSLQQSLAADISLDEELRDDFKVSFFIREC